MKRFNRNTHSYEDYSPPVADGNYTIYSEDMDEIVNCCQCGKEITFGEGCVSMEIYSGPFGHIVCRQCMEKELDRLQRGKR